MRPDLLVEELCCLGEAEASIDASAVPELDHLDPTSCYLAWEIVLTTEESRKTVEGVFIFADDADLTIEEVPAAAAPPSTCTPDTPLHDQPRPVPLSSDASAADPTEAAIGPGFQAPRGDVAPPTPGSRQGQQGEHVRVQARRLDDLMDQLGELVIAQSRLQALAADLGDSALSHLVEEIERLTGGMRDTTLSLRMLPIETVFGKFRRIVRDLSASLGKDVSLVTRGGETEIDKTVIDRLTEPLVHMIRNAMDHGIENAQTRRAQGKSEGGTITLSAWQEGGNVLIAMEDDGKGLDTDAIRRRAEDRGLIQPGAEMSEAALHALIFAPGFSTAASLSSVSGRGVGMDAVRTAVDVLRGKIAIDSTRGRGTRITLSLPVSLAIIDSFLVTLAGQVYVLPLSAVEECVEYDAAVGTAAPDCADTGRRLIELRERLIPYIDLRALFRAGGERPAGQRIVIVRSDGALIGLVVDDILGQAQTVIKALAPVHRAVGGFSGATILGDGTVALILDVVALA
ncbi:MAG: chemotaxis protein CheA, partial [Pseudomonadota bacterium]